MTLDDVLSAEPATVAGSGRIADADGVVTEIRPGVVMLCPDGWSGVWQVDETVRKTNAIVKTASGSDRSLTPTQHSS